MTDRVSGFVVALDKDIRDEDAETIATALLLIKGVTGVTTIVADLPQEAVITMRLRTEYRKYIFEMLSKIDGGVSSGGW